PIKDLIDDYDLMACALSNNLIDFDHPIYAVRGFEGDSFDKLVTNLKAKKTVGVGPDGGLDVKTVDIPIEARKEKLRIDKEAIYKFGMGFDSSQTGDGNITNVVIKSRYSLLDLKCNKIEVRLRRIIKQMLELIVENINQRYSKAYNTSDIEIIITRDIMANEVDNATIAKTEADTKQVAIQTILDAAPRLDSRTVLELLAGILEIDPDEVEKALDEEEYRGDLEQDTEVEDGVEPVSEGDATSTTTTGPEG
ncbi:phage portal protein, partial [Streptococcus suis]